MRIPNKKECLSTAVSHLDKAKYYKNEIDLAKVGVNTSYMEYNLDINLRMANTYIALAQAIDKELEK